MRKSLLICLLCLVLLVACEPASLASQSPNQNSSITSSVTPNVSTNAASPFPPYEPYQPDIINVEKLLNDNPIDKAFLAEEEMLNEQTNFNDLPFVVKYVDIWKTEMDATLNKLRSKLTEKNLEQLNTSQSDWAAFIKSDVNLASDIQLFTAGEGSGIPLLDAYKILGQYRYRTLELAEYDNMITGDFKFEFN